MIILTLFSLVIFIVVMVKAPKTKEEVEDRKLKSNLIASK